ncbi:PDZ domain-containing protein [Ferruginibacter lapsinanis]|uniref:PDZ domain-containing protein n=1 Tax=Ferruginibacter lapsinanis TaxID=563172 RepID=UPI001E4EF481|nr:PDZ domain-containing protein [Ferruginibacter lapsinanis]UEG50963.1 PDZ domain-containing protein [Ferruginibacter lapsinanis]
MKKILITATVLAFIGLPTWLWAQEDVKKDKETEEVVIRNKGDKDMKLKIEIDGDKIIVNGKPLAEFKDDQVTINKRKIIIRDGDDMMAFDFGEGGHPFNLNEDIMEQWNDGKEETRPFLGVTTEKVDDGVKITEVIEGSAAEKAGLKEGDIITNIDNDKVETANGLATIISGKKPKDEVKVYYIRKGKKANVKATLGEKKEKRKMVFSFKGSPEDMMNRFNIPIPPTPPNADMFSENFEKFHMMPRQKKLGLKIQDTEEGGNVKVIDVEDESAAATAGLQKGDIITEIGGNKVNNTDDAREQLKPVDGKSNYTIKALRNGKEMTFEVKIPKKLKTADL